MDGACESVAQGLAVGTMPAVSDNSVVLHRQYDLSGVWRQGAGGAAFG